MHSSSCYLATQAIHFELPDDLHIPLIPSDLKLLRCGLLPNYLPVHNQYISNHHGSWKTYNEVRLSRI